MTNAFDQRVVRVGLQIDGEFIFFEGLDIRANGRIFANGLPAQSTIRISNMTRATRNYVLTKASPLIPLQGERKPILVTLDVGRESYGTFTLYEGNSFASGATQPPDIGITLQSLTKNLFAALIGGYSQSGERSLRIICQSVATTLGLNLDFQATDKNIDNYSYTGDAYYQLYKLNQMGGIQAMIDGKKLVVLNANESRGDSEPRLISISTGMVGIPQVSSEGVTVRIMVDNSIKIGGDVRIESIVNPSANGTYKVNQINFDIANRAQPFYYDLFCSNTRYIQGTVGT